MALSTHPGGAADKSGAVHEALWGVRAMLEVLNGDASSIRIEEPGVDGAEFYLQRENHREYWQAKRQITSQETWTLHRLDSEGILRFFFEQYRSGHHCVFASVSDAPKLRELIENAKAASSFEEFNVHFLSKGRGEDFKRLTSFLENANEAEVFRWLRTMEVHGGREVTLEGDFGFALGAMFDGPWQTTLAVLRDRYLHGSHEVLTASDIEAHLSKCGIIRRTGSAADTPQLIRNITRTYIAGQHANLIRQDLIRRPAADDIVRGIIESSGSLDVLITSQAGGGKSGCLCQIAEGLENLGLLVLAFRLDRIEPVPTARMLGEKLGLGESPPISLMYASGGKPVVLLIDQIDCVSATSGRREEFFDTLASLLDEVAGLRFRDPIHVILACRTFDYEHDHRLKRLLPRGQQPIELGEFSDTEVQEVITRDGGDWTRLNLRQQALLRLPQNLSLFVNAGLTRKEAGFSTQKDLFDAYWTAKQKGVSKGHPDFAKLWLQAIKVATEAMSSRQELSLPASVLDEFAPEFLERMASEGVFTRDSRRYGFGHESFFDYCFARTQPNGGRDFVQSLKKDPQHLFRRAQLRQVLSFLRDDNREAYLASIAELLGSEAIRPHLKMLSVELLATDPKPAERDLKLLMPWIECEMDYRRSEQRNPDRLASRIWETFFSSRTLFPIAAQLGLVHEWLHSGEPWLEELMVRYFRWQTEAHAGRVAEFLEPFVGHRDWSGRFRNIMGWSRLEQDRRFFDLFLRLVDDGTFDEARDKTISSDSFWSTVHNFAEKRPDWCAELAAHWLERRLAILGPLSTEGVGFDSIIYERHGIDELLTSANQAPETFLNFVLPVVLRIADATSYDGDDDERLPRDAVWPTQTYGDCDNLSDGYLLACQNALGSLAESEDLGEIRPWISLLQSYRHYTANLLLLGTYLRSPAVFAEEALQLLTKECERLPCGYDDSSYWISRQLIEKCSRHCSDSTFSALETLLLSVVSPYERSDRGAEYRGYAAYCLVSSLDQSRISNEAKARLIGWKTLFGQPDETPRGILSYTVESPIEKEVARELTDEQWLDAIAEHQSDRFDPHQPGKGGASALAANLKELISEQPERFARLALRFPDQTHASYYMNILYGIKDASVESALKINVARMVFERDELAVLCAALDVLGAEGNIESDVHAFICRCALEHPNPEPEPLPWDDSDDREKLLIRGLNSVRGHAVNALTQWVQKDRLLYEALLPTIEKTLEDPSLSVRACVALTLSAVAKYDVPLAYSWMKRLLEADDVLLSTGYVVNFIRTGLPSHYVELTPFIVRMMRSDKAKARRQGGILACLARLHHHAAESLSEEALSGDEACRLGASEVAKSNLLHPECKEWCEVALRQLFNDSISEVRKSAAGCFRNLWQAPETPLTTFDSLIRAFVSSPAFSDNPSQLFRALEKTDKQVPLASLDVCEAFVARCAGEARDLRTAHAGAENSVGKLVFTAYAQLKGQEAQDRALTLIDEMILEGLHSTSGHLAEADR